MKQKFWLLVFFPIISNLTGCSTLTAGGSSQDVTVLTYNSEGKDIVKVKCELKNDEGAWSLLTPDTTLVLRSNKKLLVDCKKEGYEPGTAEVESKTKSNMWGNIVFGGGIGAIIDHNNGSAYAYPPVIKIQMGKHRFLPEKDDL